MNNFYIMVGMGCVVAAAITYLIHRIFKRKRFVKYLFAALLFVIGFLFIWKARNSHQGLADLAWIIFSMIFFAAGVVSIFVSIISDIWKDKRR